MKRLPIYLLVLCTAAVLATPAAAGPLTVALDVQGPGLKLTNGGVGLEGLGSDTRTLSITIDGFVLKAWLYWAGRDLTCPTADGACVIPSQPYEDQVLRFDGQLITGTLIGSEGTFEPTNAIGYRADVTTAVRAKGPGAVSFDIADGDLSSNLDLLNGAALVVVYFDAHDWSFARLIVFNGLDFAWGPLPQGPPEARVTVPVQFNHGASPLARTAELTMVVGDAVESRPDRIDISSNASVVNQLDGSDGPAWDTDRILITVPANTSSTTVQVVSEPLDANPDSLLWQVAALRVPLKKVKFTGCTPGYWKNHKGSWAATGFSPQQTTGSVFAGIAFPALANQTLLQALQGGGGPGTYGATRILLRAAVAALLNSAHPDVTFPRTTAQVIGDVQAALNSNNRNTMLALATALDNENQLGCVLGERDYCNDKKRRGYGHNH